MQTDAARVLVIDDDEVVLVAVADLLEECGYRVFTQGSPIGATQVIVRERIDIAVIDVNLPEMQGDSVVRLFRAWDRLKDLPVVVLSGAETSKLDQLKQEFAGLQVVPKTRMNYDLVRALDQVLTAARNARPQLSNDTPARASEPEPDAAMGRDIQQAHYDELAKSMKLASEIWREVMRRDLQRVPQATRTLEAMRSRSQLLNLETLAQLLQAVISVFNAITPNTRTSDRAHNAVDDAISALAGLQSSRTRDFPVPPTFLIRELTSIANELKSSASRQR